MLYCIEMAREFDTDTFRRQFVRLYQTLGFTSVKAFSASLDMSYSTVNDWLNGKSQPKFGDVYAIGQATGVQTDYFLTYGAEITAFENSATVSELRRRLSQSEQRTRELQAELDGIREKLRDALSEWLAQQPQIADERPTNDQMID